MSWTRAVLPTRTSREFGLVATFMRHPGQVLTSASSCWPRCGGVDHDPHSNGVDVCVRQLRTTVGSDHIETVRGVGYRFR